MNLLHGHIQLLCLTLDRAKISNSSFEKKFCSLFGSLFRSEENSIFKSVSGISCLLICKSLMVLSNYLKNLCNDREKLNIETIKCKTFFTRNIPSANGLFSVVFAYDSVHRVMLNLFCMKKQKMLCKMHLWQCKCTESI